ncbi:hypothetical protein CK203_116047 [Vitis vinifera]|uniref:Uncharacterized protein n=1 Tax=Vitis vinifera TaxID=29760 RepID=A0A438D0E1_VITVI|nr:hypothetical protein CK203_116047 [Vitis vinifera]
MKGHLPFLFKPPPPTRSPKILISEPRAHLTSKRLTPRPLRARTRAHLSFQHGANQMSPPAPSLRRTTRQRASSAQVHSDSPSQAAKAPRILPSEGGEAIGPSSPAPQCRYETRRPPTIQGRLLRTLRVQYEPSRPQAKKARTLGQVSHPELLSLLQILSLLERYNLEHLMTPREFFYPRVALDFYQSMTTRGVRSPTTIHFTIDGRHGILKARHCRGSTDSLRARDPFTFRKWSPVSHRDMLKRRRLCRERFSLNKWNQLAGYSALPGVLPMVAPPMPPQPEQGELPTETVPPVPTSKPTSVAPPITFVPLVAPTTSEPSITIFSSEFRALCIPFRHSPSLILLSSSRWLRCVPIRITPIAPIEDTTPAEVRIPPPQDEPPIVTAMP